MRSPPDPAPVATANGAYRPPLGLCPENPAEATAPAVGLESGDATSLKSERSGARRGDQRPESQTDFVGWTQ